MPAARTNKVGFIEILIFKVMSKIIDAKVYKKYFFYLIRNILLAIDNMDLHQTDTILLPELQSPLQE